MTSDGPSERVPPMSDAARSIHEAWLLRLRERALAHQSEAVDRANDPGNLINTIMRDDPTPRVVAAWKCVATTCPDRPPVRRDDDTPHPPTCYTCGRPYAHVWVTP